MAKVCGISIVCLTGGNESIALNSFVRRGAQIVIGNAGAIHGVVADGFLSLDKLEWLFIDEVDMSSQNWHGERKAFDQTDHERRSQAKAGHLALHEMRSLLFLIPDHIKANLGCVMCNGRHVAGLFLF